MNNKIHLNDDWYYQPNTTTQPIQVSIPHTNIETPLHYFDESIYQFISTYTKDLFIPNEWNDKHIFLTFEGVAHIAKVYIEDQFVGEHQGGYTAFTFDIAPFVQINQTNRIRVEVDSQESSNIPPFGNVIDYMTYGGIYREVYLEIKESTYIKDIFVQTNLLQQKQQLIYNMEVEGSLEGVIAVSFLKENEATTYELLSSNILDSNNNTYEKIFDHKELWDLENPFLYDLNIVLKKDNLIIDCKTITFGFRTCEFKKDGFYLNNKRIKLRGLNRHQSYPYVGYAMPKRVQQLDADILKEELGCNAVRTAHYPQSQHFINRCDEIGLLVFTEIPGWQHIGDQEWKEVAISMTHEMVLQYRNHPSIILWGARINESQDDDALYSRTNKIIHDLDPTRQTGGVRFFKKSSFLEDVYTYNDFSHTGNNPGLESKVSVTTNKNAPYLVSEYNGHMFPTKSFDNEEHRLSHALRHANVLQSMYASNEITGSFGWVMFDYNTHKDFGSGDRICYHGVMGMFRNKKLAASVYASQSDQGNLLEISSSMDIGEHPGGNIGKVYAFTNADHVKLYKNNEFVKDFYPSVSYKDMPHGPILIDDFIGELIEKKEHYSHANAELIKEVLVAIVQYGQYNLPLMYKLKMAKVMLLEKISIDDGIRLYYSYVGNWGGEATTYRFEAMKDNKVVKTVEKAASKNILLQVTSNTYILQEDTTYDVASLRIEVVSDLQQKLHYYQGVLHFQTTGCIELIGPSSVSAIGGSTGTYVKTTGQVGSGTLTISGEGIQSQVLTFEVIGKDTNNE